MAQQRRLARAVAPHQRDALARRDAQVDAAQHGAPARHLEPDAAAAEGCGRGVVATQARAGALRERGALDRGRRTGRGRSGLVVEQPVRAQRRARLLDPGGRRAQARAREQPRARRLERGRALAGPGEELARRRVARDRAVREDDDAVGVGQAALEPVLGEHDRRPPLLVEPPQQPDQLVAGDRVELRRRLVEQHEPRPAGERGAERDALQLAAGELVRRAVEQRRDAERERDLLHPARDRRRRRAAVLEREGELGAHGPEHDLGLGVLEQRPGDRAEVAGPVLARVEAADHDAPGERAAVEVRDEAGGGAQQRRLAARREARDDDELAGRDAQRDVAQAGAAAPP